MGFYKKALLSGQTEEKDCRCGEATTTKTFVSNCRSGLIYRAQVELQKPEEGDLNIALQVQVLSTCSPAVGEHMSRKSICQRKRPD